MTTAFDWSAPDYTAVRAERAAQLARIREHPHVLAGLREHYAHNPAAFITAWGMTSDPRLIARGLPSEIPLILMPRQVELIDFIMARLVSGESGLVEKARDCGASVIIAALAATLCLFRPGFVCGVGSRKEIAIDEAGNPNSIFHKVRFFLKSLPPEFRGVWDESRHAPHLRILFPDSPGSAIVGEAGDQIGRGGRTTIYLIDEAAFLERPELVERSLAGTTTTRIDVSTPNGRANSFAQKRWSGKLPVFTFGWRDDLRKDDAWYRRQVETLDPITVAQEIDLNYDASAEGVLLPAPWVQAAIGADRKLGIEVSGERRAALDVADEGRDKNALAGRHGILLEYLSSWSGAGSNIYATTIRALNACAKHRYPTLIYDGDGLGAGVRGDAVQVNAKRREAGQPEIAVEAFRGSGAVVDPDASMVEGRANRDFFQNAKSQGWWSFRLRFQNTYRAVAEGLPVDPDQVISIDPDLPELHQLVAELSQVTYSVGATGKLVIDKTPPGTVSPNAADAAMIAFSGLSARAFFAPAGLSADGRQIAVAPRFAATPVPARMDLALCVMAVAGDDCATVWCGANRGDDGSRGAGLHVLQWDVREVSDVEIWAMAVQEVLAIEAGKIFAPGGARIFIENWSEPWAALLRQRGFDAEELPPVPSKFPAIADRARMARPYVTSGHVGVSPDAFNTTVVLRGQRRNYLRELFEGSETSVSESNALALAFSTAVLLIFQDRGALPASPAVVALQADGAAAAPAPPVPVALVWRPTITLTPGPHTIDGEAIEIARDGDRDFVEHPLTPGRHVVDDRLVLIPGSSGLRLV